MNVHSDLTYTISKYIDIKSYTNLIKINKDFYDSFSKYNIFGTSIYHNKLITECKNKGSCGNLLYNKYKHNTRTYNIKNYDFINYHSIKYLIEKKHFNIYEYGNFILLCSIYSNNIKLLNYVISLGKMEHVYNNDVTLIDDENQSSSLKTYTYNNMVYKGWGCGNRYKLQQVMNVQIELKIALIICKLEHFHLTQHLPNTPLMNDKYEYVLHLIKN
jgi:hypothetical protein